MECRSFDDLLTSRTGKRTLSGPSETAPVPANVPAGHEASDASDLASGLY
jgi:hypothetical protein